MIFLKQERLCFTKLKQQANSVEGDAQGNISKDFRNVWNRELWTVSVGLNLGR